VPLFVMVVVLALTFAGFAALPIAISVWFLSGQKDGLRRESSEVRLERTHR